MMALAIGIVHAAGRFKASRRRRDRAYDGLEHEGGAMRNDSTNTKGTMNETRYYRDSETRLTGYIPVTKVQYKDATAPLQLDHALKADP